MREAKRILLKSEVKTSRLCQWRPVRLSPKDPYVESWLLNKQLNGAKVLTEQGTWSFTPETRLSPPDKVAAALEGSLDFTVDSKCI